MHSLKQPCPQIIERSPAWQHEANPRSCFIVNHLLQKSGFQHHHTRTRRDLLHGNMESQMFHCPPSLTINQFSNTTPLRPCLEVPSKSSLDGVWQPPRGLLLGSCVPFPPQDVLLSPVRLMDLRLFLYQQPPLNALSPRIALFSIGRHTGPLYFIWF